MLDKTRGPAQAGAQPTTAVVLSWREKTSYAVADLGFNLFWTNIATFLLIFYTDTFGISAAATATMLATIKIVNAFTDPMIGALADRTNTRWGKFRPYLIWMSVPLAAAGVLTYTTPDLGGDGKLVWAYGTYLAMMVFYTCVNIPYNALSGVMSSDPQQRSALNGLRFIFAFAGSTLVQAATPKLVLWLGAGDDKRGWQLTMVVWGIAACALFVLTFLNTRERVKSIPGQKSNVAQDVRDLAGNRPWVVLFFLALIIMVTITLRNSTAAYFFKYVVVVAPEMMTPAGPVVMIPFLGKFPLMGAFVSVYSIGAAIGASCTPLMTRFLDKKTLLILLMSMTALLSSAFFFVPPSAVTTMFVLQGALGLVLGPKSPLAFSMYADTADYNEWRTGRRATGMTFAAATFSQKLGTAVAVGVIGSVFAKLGYVANAVQTTGSQAGIVWLMSFIPAAFALLAVFVMCFYNLTGKQLAVIQQDLAERKAAAGA